jgi:hypothetical protein
VLGEHPGFDAEQWAWPLPWTASPQEVRAGVVRVAVARAKWADVRVAPKVLRLDPHAGERCNGMSGYGSFELNVPCILSGTHPSFQARADFHDGIVTPKRLAAWRRINAEVRRALAARRA